MELIKDFRRKCKFVFNNGHMYDFFRLKMFNKFILSFPGNVEEEKIKEDQKNVFEKSSCKLSFKHIFSIRNNTIKLYRCFSYPQQEAVFGTEPATYRIAF